MTDFPMRRKGSSLAGKFDPRSIVVVVQGKGGRRDNEDDGEFRWLPRKTCHNIATVISLLTHTFLWNQKAMGYEGGIIKSLKITKICM